MSGIRTHGRFAPAPLLLAAGLLLSTSAASLAEEVRIGGENRVTVGTAEVTLPASVDSVGGSDGHWMAAGVRSAGDGLSLWRGEGERAEEISPPAVGGSLVMEPSVAGTDRPSGLAWLEGASRGRLAVRFAPWDGTAWGETTTVAGPGPGSQLALHAATLDDGRTLLAWARFDGEDDEIFWAVEEGTGWSEPQALTADGTPDVTPALVSVPGGALAAWTSFEGGQYRVAVARFDGRSWSAPRLVGAPGTLYPSFETSDGAEARSGDGSRLLLYRSARPRGWTLLEIAADARPLRRAATFTTAGTTAQRPRIHLDDGTPVFVSRGGERRAAWENLP